MATLDFYPKPKYPTGFLVYNAGGKGVPVLYLHGRGGIGYAEQAGLQGLIDSKELPPDLVNNSILLNDAPVIAPRLDTYNGWNNKMIDDVLNHPAVKPYGKVHGLGFSLGAGGLANHLLASVANSARYYTAQILYTIQVGGAYSNVKGVKVICVTANDRNPGTEPAKTIALHNGLIAAGVDSMLMDYGYGDHGGALKEHFKDAGIYQWMRENSGTTQPPVDPPIVKKIIKTVVHFDDGTTQEFK